VAGKDVVKAIFARCTASLLPGASPAAVGALRQGLSEQLGRSVARQLEALMIMATETTTFWAFAMPAAPLHCGGLSAVVSRRRGNPALGTLRVRPGRPIF